MVNINKSTFEDLAARANVGGRTWGKKTNNRHKKVLDKTLEVTTAASKKVSTTTAKGVRKATGAERYQQEAIQLNERLETALQNLIIILDEKEKEIALLRQRVKDLEKGR